MDRPRGAAQTPGQALTSEGPSMGLGTICRLWPPDGGEWVCELSSVLWREGTGRATMTCIFSGVHVDVPLDGTWRWKRVPENTAGALTGLKVPASEHGSRKDLWWIVRRRSPLVRALTRLLATRRLPVYDEAQAWMKARMAGTTFAPPLRTEGLGQHAMREMNGLARVHERDGTALEDGVFANLANWAVRAVVSLEEGRRGDDDWPPLAEERSGLDREGLLEATGWAAALEALPALVAEEAAAVASELRATGKEDRALTEALDRLDRVAAGRGDLAAAGPRPAPPPAPPPGLFPAWEALASSGA